MFERFQATNPEQATAAITDRLSEAALKYREDNEFVERITGLMASRSHLIYTAFMDGCKFALGMRSPELLEENTLLHTKLIEIERWHEEKADRVAEQMQAFLDHWEGLT